MKLSWALLVCFCVMWSLAGCSTAPVADDVAQREANEIVAVLSRHDINAHLVKARGGKGRYAVMVAEGDFGRAADVLSQLGLPADKKPSFQELTAGNGIIPVSREVEALRLDRAIAAELEDLFRVRSDIASASVLVRMHSKNMGEKPTVTVLVQKSGASSIDPRELQEIAKRAVPGIQQEDVFISIADAPGRASVHDQSSQSLVSFMGLWRVREEDYGGLVLLVVGLVVFSGALAGLAGYLLGQFNWLNKQGMPNTARAKAGYLSTGLSSEAQSSSKQRQDREDDI